LRAAQAYILISMPTGTSTIFGVFQAIRSLQDYGAGGIAQAQATASIIYDLCRSHSGPAIPIRNCGEIVGSVPQTSAALRRTQPWSWSGYNALIDNVPDPRIDIGIPRQRVFAR
jgi:hypothetical protein